MLEELMELDTPLFPDRVESRWTTGGGVSHMASAVTWHAWNIDESPANPMTDLEKSACGRARFSTVEMPRRYPKKVSIVCDSCEAMVGENKMASMVAEMNLLIQHVRNNNTWK